MYSRVIDLYFQNLVPRHCHGTFKAPAGPAILLTVITQTTLHSPSENRSDSSMPHIPFLASSFSHLLLSRILSSSVLPLGVSKSYLPSSPSLAVSSRKPVLASCTL